MTYKTTPEIRFKWRTWLFFADKYGNRLIDFEAPRILKNEIIGSWGNPEDSVPVFKIDEDSILYVQADKTYPYKLINNDIVVDHSGDQWILKNVSVDLQITEDQKKQIDTAIQKAVTGEIANLDVSHSIALIPVEK